jgi:predicted phage tail protein
LLSYDKVQRFGNSSSSSYKSARVAVRALNHIYPLVRQKLDKYIKVIVFMYFAMRTGASQVATVQCIDAFQGKDNNLAPKGTFIHRLGKSRDGDSKKDSRGNGY